MSRKVIFKASVERAKREGENVTCRLSKDLPLSEAAQLVNENRTLLIEKEMTSEEFYIFLHEISKFVQKEPGLWNNNPKSLMCYASFVSAQKLTAQQTTEQQPNLIEEMACHLPAKELLDFFALNDEEEGLQEFFTINGLQKFFAHFFKTYELPNLDPQLKKRMKDIKQRLKVSLVHLIDNRKANYAIMSLGLSRCIISFEENLRFEYLFFSLKFRYDSLFSFRRAPKPEVNALLAAFIPKTDRAVGDVAELEPQHVGERWAGIEYETPQRTEDIFFSYLAAMEESVWRGSHYEVLAIGAHILCQRHWEERERLPKYFFHVWCNMALSLAKLNIPAYYALSCLQKLEPKCFAFEIDKKHFKQQIMSAYGQYDKEEEIFADLLEIVPSHSKFYRKIVNVHMSAVQKRVEDMLMELISYADELENESNEFLCLKMERLQNSIKIVCEKHIRLMHVVSSVTKYGDYLSDYDLEISYMKVYKHMAICIWDVSKNFESIYQLMQHVETHLHFTWRFYMGLDDYNQYQVRMGDFKRELQLQTRMTYPKVWADVCYLHLIFSRALRNPQPAPFLTWLYDEALEIYCKLQHPRAERLKKQYKAGAGVFVPVPFENNFNPECSIVWLTQNTPRLKEHIRTGLTSLDRFDMRFSCTYWKKFT